MRLHRTGLTCDDRGLSLVEVLIALAILGVVSLSFIGSLIFTSRTAHATTSRIFAVELANRTVEELRALGETNYEILGTDTGDAARFLQEQTFDKDPVSSGQTIQFTVSCDFKGFGTVSSAGSNSLTAVIPADYPQWETNEWVGQMVMIKDGDGSGQIAYITANTADTLTITTNLSGSGGGSWMRTPSAGDEFEINNGKTVVITISWTEQGRSQQLARTALIPGP